MFPSRLIFLSQRAQPGQAGGHVAPPRPILFLNYCHLSVGLADKRIANHLRVVSYLVGYINVEDKIEPMKVLIIEN